MSENKMQMFSYMICFERQFLNHEAFNESFGKTDCKWAMLLLFGNVYLLSTTLKIEKVVEIIDAVAPSYKYVVGDLNNAELRTRLDAEKQTPHFAKYLEMHRTLKANIAAYNKAIDDAEKVKEEDKKLDEQFEKSPLAELLDA